MDKVCAIRTETTTSSCFQGSDGLGHVLAKAQEKFACLPSKEIFYVQKMFIYLVQSSLLLQAIASLVSVAITFNAGTKWRSNLMQDIHHIWRRLITSLWSYASSQFARSEVCWWVRFHRKCQVINRRDRAQKKIAIQYQSDLKGFKALDPFVSDALTTNSK